MDGSDIGSSGGHLGLLLGPEPQGDNLHVVDAIPLGSEGRFTRLPEMLLAGIESVRQEAWQQRSHTIVGWYRIARAIEDSLSEGSFEFDLANGQEHSALANVRCCFVFVCLPASEAFLRVYIRNGEHWEQIQELTRQWESPSADLTPQYPAATFNVTARPAAGEPVSWMARNVHGKGRLWFDVAIVALLLLSLGLNTLMVRFARRIQRERVNLQPVVNQIRESPTAASQLPPPAAASVPEASRNQTLAEIDLPAQQVSNPPRTTNLGIAKKPATLKPAEAFQFQVKGNPPPEVVWSTDGPGSIDPVYGLYRAPGQFAGETKVKIIAKSWSGSQSVTFTLRGSK